MGNASTPGATSGRRSPRRSRLFLAVLVLLLAVAGGVAVAVQGDLLTTDVVTEPPRPAAAELSVDEQAYYDYVAPRLRQAAAEARYLADLGERRSRNVVDLQAHREELDRLIGEIRDYGDEHGVPERFAEVETAFRQGATLASQAMRDGIEAFTSFDFARFGEIVPVFREGADYLDRAAATFDERGGAGPATPTS